MFGKNRLNKIIFLAVWSLAANAIFAQKSVTSCYTPVTADGKPPKTRLRLINETDLPDFSQAIQIINCETKTFLSPFEHQGLDPNVFITIKEHLQELPSEPKHLRLRLFKQENGGKLYELNKCDWDKNGFHFEEDGSLEFGLFQRLNFYFLIESDLRPDCYYIIWYRTNQIPIGKKAFFFCGS